MTVKVFYNNGDIRTLGNIEDVRTSDDNLILKDKLNNVTIIEMTIVNYFRCFI